MNREKFFTKSTKKFAAFLVIATLCSAPAFAFVVNTTQSGAEIKWQSTSEVTYYIDISGGPDGSLAAIRDAMQTWTDVESSSFSFIFGSIIESTTCGENDGENITCFGPLADSGIVGLNTIWFNPATGAIVDSDVQFNTNHLWSTDGALDAFDVQSIAAHELGHSLSLADLFNPADAEKMMYGFGSLGEIKRELHQDDINGISYLYPSGTQTTTSTTTTVSPSTTTTTSSIITTTTTVAASTTTTTVPTGTPPRAFFTIDPPSGDFETVFTADASESSDAEDSRDALLVRWDWENDAVWDTGFNTAKTATHQYAAEGTHTIRLQVQDTESLTGTATRTVTVEIRACPVSFLLGPDDPRLTTLRQFRDTVLSRTKGGKACIKLYEKFGAQIIKLLSNKPRVKAITRAILDAIMPAIEKLVQGASKHRGVAGVVPKQ